MTKETSMKSKRWIIIGVVVLVALAATATVAAASMYLSETAQLRRATAQFHQTEAAKAAGYDFVEGLDHCFFSPGVGGMGYHLINVQKLDTTVEALAPEAMVYRPQANGQLKLVAVEYIVPAEAWDAEGHSQLPSVLGRSFHLNEALGVYVLHAWIWENNPAGMYEDFNPRVSCDG
jgi:hypothetical protein